MNTIILVRPPDRRKGPLCLASAVIVVPVIDKRAFARAVIVVDLAVRAAELERFSFALQRWLGHSRDTLSTLGGKGPGWQV